jgi:Mg2+ and Co2+ transporter CorA
MIFRHEYVHGTWIDLEQPSAEDIREIAQELALSEHIERELLSPTPNPLVTGEDGAALLVLHFPTQGTQDGETKSQEIDFVVGKNFIVTVRYEIIAPIHHLKKLLEAQELVEGKAPLTTDVLLEVLFAHLYTSMRDHTNRIAANLAHVEKEMFDGHERSTVRAISNIGREFLHIETALVNQQEAIEHFLGALAEFGHFGRPFVERSKRILAERTQVARLVSTHRAVTTELRETNLALLESRQNEIMKTLTVITVILFPLEFMAVTFDIHAPGTPIIDHPQAFWIILGIMFVTAVIMTTVFARKRWIF